MSTVLLKVIKLKPPLTLDIDGEKWWVNEKWEDEHGQQVYAGYTDKAPRSHRLFSTNEFHHLMVYGTSLLMDFEAIEKNFTKAMPVYWLNCTGILIELGFSVLEIEQALEQEALGVRELTDVKGFKDTPRHYRKMEIIREGVGVYVTDHRIWGGKTYENTERVTGTEVRLSAQYQGLKHGRLIKRLLSNRLPWFNNRFKWEAYEISHNAPDSVDIYLSTKMGSLYVPVWALLAGDTEAITKRMTVYYKGYRLSSSYSLNKNKGESFEDFEVRKMEEYKRDILPLKSKTTKRLFKLMKPRKEDHDEGQPETDS